MSSSKLPQFEGVMVPTFTPFDSASRVNYEMIEPYARLLKSKGLSAFLVNGTTGEGMSMSVSERKKTAEKWHEVCRKLDVLLMVQISGCPFADAVELARHAALLNVDGVLCLPELYTKPKTVEKLVQYLKDIAVHCPKIPLYYYHIPILTSVDLPMANLMELARKEIPSFAGIKFSSGDLEKAIQCLKHGQVFLGPNTIFCGALALGFRNAIMTSLNVNPEVSLKIWELMEQEKLAEAREHQHNLNQFVETVLKKGKNLICQLESIVFHKF